MFPQSPFPKVSVVMCSLNEAQNLFRVLPDIPKWVDEILLVDGYSTDDTVTTAKKLSPNIKVLYQPKKGKGDALKYGVAVSQGEIIVTLDADGTYSPREMHKFIEAILNGYDFAKGTRFLYSPPSCMKPNRRLGNKILTITGNLLFRTKYTDICSGYYAFRKDIFQKICPASNGFEMEQEMFLNLRKKQLKVVEIPHSYSDRTFGISKTHDVRQGIKNFACIFLFRIQSGHQT